MKFFSSLIFSILLFIQFAYSQTNMDKIRTLMEAYHNLGQFNGTVLVAEQGKLIFKEGFGYANMEWKVKNEPDTKFLLGSLSKQFTAMLILQLADRSLVSLNKTISDYLPYYPQNSGKKITIRQLLNHTSGIPDIMNFPDFDEKFAYKHFTTKELLSVFDTLKLDFEAGTNFSYSNSGYAVLAAVIEQVTNKTYGEVLEEFITEPHDMKNTGYAPSNAVIPKYASGYRWAPLDDYIHPIYFDNSISMGSGGIHSTVEDLYKWDQALYSNKLVSDSLRKQMFTPNKYGYGYGFWINRWENPNNKDTLTFVEHGGANVGFNSLIFRSIDDKNTIILLTNTTEAKLGFIRNRIRSILYDRPYDLPEAEIKNIVADELKNKGLAAAKNKYREFYKTKLEFYGGNEFIYEFSQLGYSLLLSGHLSEAIEIYKLNAEAFPGSSKVFDDLGEAYMYNGDIELAIKYYTKALELDQQNLRIKRMLNKLKQ